MSSVLPKDVADIVHDVFLMLARHSRILVLTFHIQSWDIFFLHFG